ncbi:guanosine-5'-triphosphate,3'-diphosphate diphosphatase [Oceanisphaera arctica]|uniref:Guanosine-5'-triphosphate,3'-diphosphate pyrophosphatase n=1 Tax=Oceanisphaera arctica TaxID=641510 RepID=A0A2P5TNX1_9GAMM|nr:guanosine-5'-triphosphate,3'-diphosphate diphosphatase [Oceanisphaera arctica]PPL17290.1 guanosine-5'-triphosphate,3'-diphosphate pyrophosphatase [Oceanisphaera arctica]GHA19997.1 guanosine-5'-triphosphate,3'-diphosphate pyrophosphatase [Oceanisphaera arctica]
MKNADLYAAVDLGSNSFHMLVVHEVAGACRTLAKIKRKVRLAAGLQADGSLDAASMQRGWDCLQLFAEQLQDIPADHIRIVGTATLRLATNITVFLERAQAILGHPIRIISGEEEAATIYEGVAWTSSGVGRRLVIDIGGASTELIVGEGTAPQLLNSLHMGCVTWLNRYFVGGQLSAANFDHAIAAARQTLMPVAGDYLKLGWQNCIGASGTVQAIQEIMISQGEDEQITLAKLMQLKQQAIACGHLDRLQQPGLQVDRVTVFPSGLAILIALFEMLAIDSMTLAGGALREGLIYGMLGRRRECDARVRTADSLISRYQLDREQAERVRNTALKALQQLPNSQNIDSPATAMLGWAALLYELGLCIEYKRAPEHAAYIIRHVDLPGFTPAQKQLLAALLLNQRDDFRQESLEQQSAIETEQAILLARLLRLAIILCLRRTRGTVPEFRLVADAQQLTLTLPANWSQTHHLRASELQQEAQRQTAQGWPLVIQEQD